MTGSAKLIDMPLDSLTDWIGWAGIVIPLVVTAVSAFLYVRLELKKQKSAKYDQFYKLMDQIGAQGGSIASKMAAISELKKYPEYRDVIIRLCLHAGVGGAEAHLLEKEFELTAQHFGAHRPKGISI
jgi:hypothetical protein